MNIYDLRLCINLTLCSNSYFLVTVADKKLSMHLLAKWCLLSGIATVTNNLKLKMTERKCLKYAGDIAGSTGVVLRK